MELHFVVLELCCVNLILEKRFQKLFGMDFAFISNSSFSSHVSPENLEEGTLSVSCSFFKLSFES